MNCPECNASIPDNSIFCPYCGNTLNGAAPQPPMEPEPIAPTVPVTAPVCSCINCGTPYAPDDIFCGYCGKDLRGGAIPVAEPPVTPQPPVVPVAPIPFPAPDYDLSGASTATKRADKKKKKGKGLKITLIVIALVLVIALVVGLLTNWYGLNGPAVQIINAAKKTLESGSFRITVSHSYEYGQYNYSDSETYNISIDYDSRELTLVQMDDTGTVSYAIYKGYQIRHYEGYYGSFYSAYDISNQIDRLFDVYESTGEFDLKELLDSIDDDAYDNAKDLMDMEELEESIKEVYGNLNNEWWLKDHAGYSKSTSNGVTTHTLQPEDLYKLSSEVLEEFEDAFKDEVDYEHLQDELSAEKDEMQNMDLKLVFQVEDGCLSAVEYSIENKGSYLTMSIEFEDIGATGIDTDTLNQILVSAQTW